MNYIPSSRKEQQRMLSELKIKSFDALFSDVPQSARLKQTLRLPRPLSEPELLEELREQSEKNKSVPFLGGGTYNHFIPSVVKHLLSRGEFLTAYTPYQAEASQGTLQVIYEYQSLICEMTGLDVANASMYDGATALAEAALLASRVTGRKEVLVSEAVHPEYRKVLKTYAKGAGLNVTELPFSLKTGTTESFSPSEKEACFIIQQPNFFGCIEPLLDKQKKNGALFIVVADPISLGLLRAPSEYGADIVVGEGQSLGIPQNFGGPGLGIFAAKESFKRQIPGRIVGATQDTQGRRGYVLTLQPREQHIRRERATSNICSNEALCALAACIYLSLMGKSGLRRAAELCLQKSNYLKKKVGSPFSAPSFKEFVVKTQKKVGIDLGQFYPKLKGLRLIFVSELAKKEELDKLGEDLCPG